MSLGEKGIDGKFGTGTLRALVQFQKDNKLSPDGVCGAKTLAALKQKIAALENIVPTDAEVEEEYATIAKAYNMDVERVKSMIAPEAIIADMKVKKAMELVKEKAVIVAKPADAE